MADWRQATRARLIGDVAVNAAARGVSYGERPPGSPLPWLVLQVVSDGRPQTLKGFTEQRPARVQFDALAETIGQAVALSEAAVVAIGPAGTFEDVDFGRAVIEPRGDGCSRSETRLVHRVSFDAIFWHN